MSCEIFNDHKLLDDESCNNCAHFDEPIEIGPCSTCLQSSTPVYFEPRRVLDL